MDEVNVISVEICGREYKIRAFADERYILKVAKFVDEKMKELAKSSSLPSHEKLAILTALNIADELFREREDKAETLSMVEERCAHIIQKLEGAFLPEVQRAGREKP